MPNEINTMIIKLVEAKNYRSLLSVQQPLMRFQVLIGPNASGKTTFLDIISFISDILVNGIDYAIAERSASYNDLTFGNKGGDIELAIEAQVPENIREKTWNSEADTIRYEIRFGLTRDTQEHAIFEERVVLFNSKKNPLNPVKHTLFPYYQDLSLPIVNRKYQSKTYRQIVRKKEGGNDNYADETYSESGKGWIPSFRLGIKRSALGNLPADEHKFPTATWLRTTLIEGVQLFILDSLNIRKASPPGQVRKFKTDGSNLPWVIDDLYRTNKHRFDSWIEHIRTALPDIKGISVHERADDRHRYLVVHYDSGISVPSWLVSDGTLRLLALTLPAYLLDFSGVYLIEEPENGIHPKAMETVFQSLSSVYNAQILMASHSPVILSMVPSEHVLCFAKTDEGITDIVKGNEHPLLRDWRGEVNLSVLYAGGILG